MGEHCAFFYGTLVASPSMQNGKLFSYLLHVQMATQVLHRVIYGSPDPEPWQSKLLTIKPAILHKFCRHKVLHCDYPAIIPQPDSTVRGTYVTGLTQGDIWRLDIFEGSEYAREKVKVKLLAKAGNVAGEGNVESEEVDAETYVWMAGEHELEPGEWDFAVFVKEKMARWAGRDEEYAEVDKAVQSESSDPTGGRGLTGNITSTDPEPLHDMQIEMYQAVLCAICRSAKSLEGESADHDEVAIFKRSGEAGMYKHKWAAISRSLEAPEDSLLDAAWGLVKEEASLDSNDLSLLRPGKPYLHIDPDQNVFWEIHPFAFILKPGAKEIQLNPKNTEHKFVRLEDVDNYDTLPNLSANFRRVLVGRDTAAGLQALQDDHSNGARVLAITGLKTLLQAVEGNDLDWAKSTEEFWTGVRFVGWHIAKNSRPSMGAAIEAAVLRALKPVSEIGRGGNLSAFKAATAEQIKFEIRTRETSINKLSTHFTTFLNDLQPRVPQPDSSEIKIITILTLSSSSTLAKCLLDFLTSGKTPIHLHLQIMESRPLFEGATFASSLLTKLKEKSPESSNRLKVKIASDASAVLLARTADCVLLGADRISYKGDVSNKTGSLVAVLVAKHVHPDIPVSVVSETDKIAGRGEIEEHKDEDNDINEVAKAWPMSGEDEEKFLKEEGVSVRNVYFEWVPREFVARYVTEEGVLEKENILRISRERERLEQMIFGDL